MLIKNVEQQPIEKAFEYLTKNSFMNLFNVFRFIVIESTDQFTILQVTNLKYHYLEYIDLHPF